MDQKDTYTRVFLEAAGQSADLDTVKQYRAAWWWNVRDKDKGGLRLSEQALNFINEYAKIKTYKIEFKCCTFSHNNNIFFGNIIR